MKIWKEKLDPSKHKDYMSTNSLGGDPVKAPKDNLIEAWVYFVKECGFTFQFISLEQIEECIDYFSTKTHPSTKEYNNGLEHYWQKWYERLPSGLTKNGKREKVLKTLTEAKEKIKNGKV
ncbi:MAG: hypothetical protein HRT88_20475 [Lentisphaeraceae bacterium]|nr:hypothetical protein [Lentisphaeraceae bacterium]